MQKTTNSQRTKRPIGTLEQVFPNVISSLGIGSRYAGWNVVEHWPEIVGPTIAKFAKAIRFTEGTLYVAVPDAAWRQELQAQIETLHARIREFPGGQAVTVIRLVHGVKGNDSEYSRS